MSLRGLRAVRVALPFSPVKFLSASAILIGIALCLSDGEAKAAPLLPNLPVAAMHAPANVEQVRAVVRRRAAVVGPRGRAVVRRGGAVVGPRGGAVVRRTTVVRPGVRWARPGWYRWPVGGAIAAGAAVGFVTAATAAAWAGAAPSPGMCWYYTDSSRRQGFWDYCPQ